MKSRVTTIFDVKKDSYDFSPGKCRCYPYFKCVANN